MVFRYANILVHGINTQLRIELHVRVKLCFVQCEFPTFRRYCVSSSVASAEFAQPITWCVPRPAQIVHLYEWFVVVWIIELGVQKCCSPRVDKSGKVLEAAFNEAQQVGCRRSYTE